MTGGVAVLLGLRPGRIEPQPRANLHPADHCRRAQLHPPVFNILSDRRGGRTAWSCTVAIPGQRLVQARFWYDGQYVNNAKEDAAEVALQQLTGGGPGPGAGPNAGPRAGTTGFLGSIGMGVVESVGGSAPGIGRTGRMMV
jgi:hypothetical protein